MYIIATGELPTLIIGDEKIERIDCVVINNAIYIGKEMFDEMIE